MLQMHSHFQWLAHGAIGDHTVHVPSLVDQEPWSALDQRMDHITREQIAQDLLHLLLCAILILVRRAGLDLSIADFDYIFGQSQAITWAL